MATETPSLRLRRERDRFVGFAFAGGDLLVEADREGVVRFAAGAARSFAGRDADGLAGLHVTELIAAEHRAAVARALVGLAATGRLGPLLVRLSEPTWAGGAVVLTGHRLPDGDGRCQFALKAAPSTDLLDGREPDTGLLDRGGFERHLVERVRARGGAAGAAPGERLTLLDLDGLQTLGERLDGPRLHALRAEIAGALRAHAADHEGVGALDDRKFGLVHGAGLDLDGLERDLAEIGRRADPDGVGIRPKGATIELAVDAGMSEDDAGRALLYAINKFARSSAEGFSISSLRDGLHAVLDETVARVGDYRSRLEAGAVQLAYQPIVGLAAPRAVHHYEALARLENGRSPSTMVAFAEEVGVVGELDLFVCRRVLDLLEAPGAAGLRVAVNLSGRSLQSAVFTGALIALLDRHAGARGRLPLEVTESAAIERLEPVAGAIRELRRRGFPVCLDDFGAGAAAFHYLRLFEVDFVKIDGSYVRTTDARDRTILRGIVALCRDLRIATVAEMVEREDEARELARLGVDLGQGYLFGRPSPDPPPAAPTPAPPVRPRTTLVLRPGGVIEALG